MLRFRSFLAVVSLLFVAFVALAPTASAGEVYPLPNTPSTALGNDISIGDPPEVAAATGGQSLPVTGSDVAGLTVLGLVAVGAGFALVRYQRSAASRT